MPWTTSEQELSRKAALGRTEAGCDPRNHFEQQLLSCRVSGVGTLPCLDCGTPILSTPRLTFGANTSNALQMSMESTHSPLFKYAGISALGSVLVGEDLPSNALEALVGGHLRSQIGVA
jgi:hypothetical protein